MTLIILRELNSCEVKPMRALYSALLLLINLRFCHDVRADSDVADKVPDLVSALETGDQTARVKAARDLGAMGVEAKSAIPTLVEVLKKEPYEQTPLSREVSFALEKSGVDLSELLAKSIDKKDEILATHLCIAIVGSERAKIEKAAAVIKARLMNPDPRIRTIAIDTITVIKPSDSESARLLIELARDREPRVSYRAISALGFFTPTREEIVKALTLLSKSSSPAIRYRAIASLGQIGSDAKSSLKSLVSISKSGEGPIAKKATEAITLIDGKNTAEISKAPAARAELSQRVLSNIVPDLEPAVEAVNLKTSDSTAKDSSPGQSEAERLKKVEALNFSVEANQAIQIVLDGLNDSSPAVRKEALKKLSERPELSSPELAQALVKSASDSDSEIRDTSSKLLLKTGTTRMNAIVAQSASAEAATRLRAVKILRNFNRPLSTEAVIALKQTLNDPDEKVRTQSAITLAMSNSLANETIPVLLRTLQGDDLSAALSATVALSKFTQEAVKPLTLALNDENPLVRSRAITALGLMEPPPENIIEVLTPLLQDGNADVRSSAAQALKSIQATNPGEE